MVSSFVVSTTCIRQFKTWFEIFFLNLEDKAIKGNFLTCKNAGLEQFDQCKINVIHTILVSTVPGFI